ACPPRLPGLDARRAYIQPPYRLRSHSKHVPAFIYGVCLRSSGSFHRRLDFLFAPRFRFHRLHFHPLTHLRFLEAPAIAQLKRRNFLFIHILVKRVRTHSQILRRLANIHHFSRVGHNVSLSHRIQTLSPAFSSRQRWGIWENQPLDQTRSSVFWCAEHSSTGTEGLSTGIHRFFGFVWVFFCFPK